MPEQNILLEIVPWLSSYLYALAFIAPIVGGGELGVIAVSFLFSDSINNFLIVLFFSFLGMLFIDSVWFFLARSKLFNNFKNWKSISKHYKKIEEKIEKFTHGKDALVLLLAKLLAGTRIFIMLYLGGRKLSYKKFLYYDFLPTLIWAVLLVTIGLLAAKGFTSIIEIFQDIQIGITFLILCIFILYGVQRWISTQFMKKLKR